MFLSTSPEQVGLRLVKNVGMTESVQFFILEIIQWVIVGLGRGKKVEVVGGGN